MLTDLHVHGACGLVEDEDGVVLKECPGERQRLSLAPERPLMLLFVDPHCAPCKELFPDVGHWQAEHSDKLSVAFVSRGEPEENSTMALEHDLTDVLLQEDWEVGYA